MMTHFISVWSYTVAVSELLVLITTLEYRHRRRQRHLYSHSLINLGGKTVLNL